MLDLNILPCRLKDLGVKLVEESRNCQIEIHHGQFFPNAASPSTPERNEIFLQLLQLFSLNEPPFRFEGQWFRVRFLECMVASNVHANDRASGQHIWSVSVCLAVVHSCKPA